jgi:hypothetical protein
MSRQKALARANRRRRAPGGRQAASVMDVMDRPAASESETSQLCRVRDSQAHRVARS